MAGGLLLVCAGGCEPVPDPPSGTLPLDLLILGGRVLDGAGNPWVRRDIGVEGDRIAFVGRSSDATVEARDTLDATGLLVTPGFIDMHSHAELEEAHEREARSVLTQGITTVVLGVDGFATADVTETFDRYRERGIAVNALRYVGHNSARLEVMGAEDRGPTADELSAMEAYIRRGMEEGALGLSSGLFYVPGSYSDTDEVIALNGVAAEYGGIYDTHDRDLGAAYQGVGYLPSIREAIEIGETAGTPVIFSHFNAQGQANYGRAPEAARLVDAARDRGVDVMAAQHVYTATHSSLSAYAIPRWASAGGRTEMLARFADAGKTTRLDVETMEMLDIRSGPGKLLFTDPRPELNGRTLAQVAADRGTPVPETVRSILAVAEASVMNLELYDIENTRFLAQQEWMMTCTDGFVPEFGSGIVHPRAYGAFPRKLRLFVYEDSVISLPFAVRGMTSLPAEFLGIRDRGLIRPGFYADIAAFDESRIRDHATFDDPHRYSEGVVHLLVNGEPAIRDGEVTGTLAGRPIPRGG